MLARVLTAFVVVAGLTTIAIATDGFRTVTTEGARRLSVLDAPRALPDVTMTDHRGRTFHWQDFAGHPLLVEFIFTTCPDICQKMSADLATAVRSTERGNDRAIRFVSLTFDPENDTVAQLNRVASSFGADGERWRFARISEPDELAATLEAFGIVAIASPDRGFEHNAAIHGLNPKGQLAKIGDISDADGMVRWARLQIE